jgi:hypothetical protein
VRLAAKQKSHRPCDLAPAIGLRAGNAGLFTIPQIDEEIMMSRLSSLTGRGITFGALALLVFGLGPAVAKAAPVVFDATGVFESGTLTGTITIDTATGNVSSANLAIAPVKGHKDIVFNVGTVSTDAAGNTEIYFAGETFLVLIIPTPSLIG